ncbi:MAG: hypothetical protein ACKVN9_03485, partial [Methylophilaceae bacterium]
VGERGEAEGFVYATRSSLKGGFKLSLLQVVIANHYLGKDTRADESQALSAKWLSNSHLAKVPNRPGALRHPALARRGCVAW